MDILKRFSMTAVLALLLVTTSAFADKPVGAKASKQAETGATPAAIAGGGNAQCKTKPPARGYGLTTYDWNTGKLYLIGGVDEQTPDYSYPLRDVWVYNTDTCWTLLLESEDFYNAMQRDAMALDPESQQIVLYATFVHPEGGPGMSVQTWIYDISGNTFKDVTSGTEPTLRWGSRMVYDDESGKAILFGGTDGNDSVTTLDDTWAFDFDTKQWTQMRPAQSPPPLHFAAMAYHRLDNRVVLFGGFVNEAGTSLNGTWTYDYNKNIWTEVGTAVSPPARLYHTLAWDVSSSRMIMFGGVVEPYKPLFRDTWALDLENGNESWTQLKPTRSKPRARAWHVMEGTREGVLLYGGSRRHSPYTYDDTWIYKSGDDRWIPIIR